MDNIVIPKADKGYDIIFSLTNSGGTALNLTGYTIKLKVWKPGAPGTLLVDGSCVIDSPTGGTCHYTLTGTDFAAAGRYLAEIELSAGSTVVDSTDQFLIIVKESG
jgi:hypothetical protein